MARFRTVKQLIATATTGEQKPCGFLGIHSERHWQERHEYRQAHPKPDSMTWADYRQTLPPMSCPECTAWQQTMNDAWNKGGSDARAHASELTPAQLETATDNVTQAWVDIDPIEPAVSYLAGYHAAMADAAMRVREGIPTR